LRSGLGQEATYACVPLSPSSIIGTGQGVISLTAKVTTRLVESNSSLLPSLSLSHLTAKKPGSSPSPMLVIEYGTILLFTFERHIWTFGVKTPKWLVE